MIAKIRKFFQTEEKLAFKMYYPDFGGRSSRNAARFSGVTRKVLSLKTYLAMFLRTSSLKRLNSFRAAEDIPCCVQKNTSPKFLFVVCNWGLP